MVVEIKNGSFCADGKVVFQHLNLVVSGGEMVALTGTPGCGKTALLRVLLGFCHLTDGFATIDGTLVTTASSPTFRQMTAYVPQGIEHLSQLFQPQTMSMPDAVPCSVLATDCWATSPASVMKFSDCSFPVEQPLSPSDTVRMIRNTLVADDKQLVLADMPTDALPDEQMAAVAVMLRRQAEAGKSVIVATSDHRLLSLCDRIVTINETKED